LLAGCVAACLGLVRPCQAQRDTIWQYTSAADIDWIRVQKFRPHVIVVTPDQVTALETRSGAVAWRAQYAGDLRFVSDPREGPLYVASGRTLLAVDPMTGTELWKRQALPELARSYVQIPNPGMPLLLQDSSGVQAISVQTGVTLWDLHGLTGAGRPTDYFTMDSLRLMVLFLQGPTGTTSLMGLSIDSGTVRWQRDDLFTRKPSYRSKRGLSRLKDFQLATVGDSAFVLYLTADGPSLIDARNGRTIWQGSALAGRNLAPIDDGYMRMCHCMQHLLVPFERGLAALDPASGALQWETELPDAPTSVYPARAGVLLSGVERTTTFVMLLDSAGGRPLWGPVPLGANSRILWSADTVVAVQGKKLVTIPVSTGSVTEMARIKFKDRESPQQLQPRPGGGYVLVARQNLLGLSNDGAVLYNRYYPAPGPSFGDQLIGGTSRKGFALTTRQMYYGLTEAPSDDGGHTFSIVATSLGDGTEYSRVVVNARDPIYEIDTRLGYVFMVSKKRDLTARDLHVPPGMLKPSATTGPAAADSTAASDSTAGSES
jgi:outer membrane protein assembly factor BamB